MRGRGSRRRAAPLRGSWKACGGDARDRLTAQNEAREAIAGLGKGPQSFVPGKQAVAARSKH